MHHQQACDGCAGEVRVVCLSMSDVCRRTSSKDRQNRIVSDNIRNQNCSFLTNLSSLEQLKTIKMQLSLPLSFALIASASAFAPAQKAFVSSKLLLFVRRLDLS